MLDAERIKVTRSNKINDEERRQWIQGDEGLYNMQRSSGLSTKTYIRQNRARIDEVILNIRDGKKQPHYLVYG